MASQLHIEPPHCCAAGTQNPSKISGTLTWQAGSAGRLFVTNAGGSGYTIGPARPETLGDLVDCSLSRTFLPEFPFLGFIFVGGLVLFELNQKSPGRTAFQRILHRTKKLYHGNHLFFPALLLLSAPSLHPFALASFVTPTQAAPTRGSSLSSPEVR